jgi:rod shape-determining protein MreC
MARDTGLIPIDDLVDASRPFKALLRRFAYLLLIGAAVALILIGKIETVLIERLRANFSDGVAPVLELLSEPIRLARTGAEHVVDLADLIEENERLKEENQRLLQWRVFAKKLEGENLSLKALLRFDPGPKARFVAARAIADVSGAFARAVLINVGSAKGVRAGLPAMTGDGLVGRVVHVGTRTARLLLLTDIKARTPVIIGDPPVRAILTGDNSDNPKLKFIDGEAALESGALIVTSGHGGVFPPGLPVGIVAGQIAGQTWVQTFVDWRNLGYVRVVDFGENVDPAIKEGPADAG